VTKTGPFVRSQQHRLLAGVCGGIAERLGWSPWIVRVLFVVGSILPVLPGFLVYLGLWIFVPLERRERSDQD
jgi:phage shock protein PspC (stress-responsive transcriptional regulator)